MEDMMPDLDVPNLQSAGSFEADEAVCCLAVSEDGTQVAVGSAEDVIWVLESASMELAHRLGGHKGGVNGLQYAEGARLISAGEDGTAAVWSSASGERLHSLACEGEGVDRTPSGHSVNYVAVSSSGKEAAVAAGRTIHLFDATADDIESSRRTYPAAPSAVTDLRFIGDERLLAAYYEGLCLQLLGTGQQGVELDYATLICSADGTPDGKWLVGGCMDRCVHIWKFGEEREEGTHVTELNCGGYSSKVIRVDFDPSGEFLASASGDRNTIWTFSGVGPAGSIPAITLGHNAALTCQAWQRKPGGLLATGGKDGRVLVFDPRDVIPGMPNLCLPLSLAMTQDEVTQLSWGAGNELFSGHTSGTVRRWLVPEQAP